MEVQEVFCARMMEYKIERGKGEAVWHNVGISLFWVHITVLFE
jgi:hypothetical protein